MGSKRLGLVPYRRRGPDAEAVLEMVGPSDAGRAFYEQFMTMLADDVVGWLLTERDNATNRARAA